MPVVATSVGGLPAFLTEGPEGPARAALVFRVGMSDERLADRGVTHLVEHLAMHALGRTVHDSNAFVDALRTVFYATGTAEEISQFFSEVSTALHALPLDRLQAERRVLQTEAARRGASAQDELLTYRFGARTYGVRAYPEHGVQRLAEDDVAAWASSRFVAQNAAIWSSVALPDLDLRLPSGERREAAEPHSVDALPARFSARTALGLDVVAPRSLELTTGWQVLRQRVFDSLRTEHAVVYDVATDRERIGRESRRLVLLTDPLPEVRHRAGRLLTQVLEGLLQDGVTEEEVRRITEPALRAMEEPAWQLAGADSCVFDTLLGAELSQPESWRAEQEALDATQVTQALREALGSALVAVPETVATVLPLAPVAVWSSTPATGTAFESKAGPGGGSHGSRPRLIVGETAVSLALDEHDFVTVPYETCEACLRWDDGSRRLIGRDGFSVAISPWEWQDGEGAVAALDAAVPPAVVIPMGQGEGPPPAASSVAAPGDGPSRRSGQRLGVSLAILFGTFTVSLNGHAPDVTGRADAGPFSARGCDRHSDLDVLLRGAGPAVKALPGQAGDQLGAACRRAALSDLSIGLIVLLVVGVLFVVFRLALPTVRRQLFRWAQRRVAEDTRVSTDAGASG